MVNLYSLGIYPQFVIDHDIDSDSVAISFLPTFTPLTPLTSIEWEYLRPTSVSHVRPRLAVAGDGFLARRTEAARAEEHQNVQHEGGRDPGAGSGDDRVRGHREGTHGRKATRGIFSEPEGLVLVRQGRRIPRDSGS